jgi:hypothetical protein
MQGSGKVASVSHDAHDKRGARGWCPSRRLAISHPVPLLLLGRADLWCQLWQAQRIISANVEEASPFSAPNETARVVFKALAQLARLALVQQFPIGGDIAHALERKLPTAD